MAASCLFKGCRLLIFNFLFCSVFLTALSQDPDPKCTDDRKGLQACNFNKNKCLQEPTGSEEAWVHVPEPENGNFTPYEKGYVYLDPNKSQGKPRKLTGKISKDIPAICVDFFYNSIGTETTPITFYIQKGEIFQAVHRVQANTGGVWYNTSFSCCLPALESEKQIAIEATSTKDDLTVAIDYLDIRHSNMTCDGKELVCYPTLEDPKAKAVTTVGPVTDQPEPDVPASPGDQTGLKLPTCASDYRNSGVPSCNFTQSSQSSEEVCGWHKVTHKIFGAVLIADVADDVQSICMEIVFSLGSNRTDLRDLFSLIIINGNESIRWAESYNYLARNLTEWKINLFEGVLAQGKDRQILLQYMASNFTIESIHVKTSNVTPSTTPKGSDSDSDKQMVIFKCPIVSKNLNSLIQPLCGMTPSPDQEFGEDVGWEEVVASDDFRNSTFPGKSHYILYKGTGQNLSDTGASLSIGSFNNEVELLLSFSYALSGQATVEVLAVGQDKDDVLVWSSEGQTVQGWVDVKDAPVNMMGRMQIVFNIISPNETTDKPVQVGLTDIKLTTALEDPSTNPPDSGETEPTGPSEKDDTKDTDEKTITSSSNSSSLSSNTGVIVGAVIGAFIGLALIAGTVYWFYFRNRDEDKDQDRYVVTMQNGSSEQVPHNIENIAYSP